MADTRIRVLCADDQRAVAEAMGVLLPADRFDVAAVSSLCEVDGAIARFAPHIVLLDLDMPGGEDPLDWLRSRAERWPLVRVVVHSGHVARELVDRALSAGAWGYLVKGDDLSAVPALLEDLARRDRLAFSSSAPVV